MTPPMVLGDGDEVSAGNSAPAKQLEIKDGTAASPVSTPGTTMRISRTENYPNGASGDGGGLNQERAAGLMVSVKNQPTSKQQVVGVTAFTDNQASGSAGAGPGDSVAAFFTGEKTLNSGEGVCAGMFAHGVRFGPDQTAMGAEIRCSNETSTPGQYADDSAGGAIAVWLTSNSGGSPESPTTAAVATYSGGDATRAFRKGIAFLRKSVTEETIRDETDSETSILIGGHHAVGIDLAGPSTNPAAYSHAAIRIGPNCLITTGLGSPQERITAGPGSLYLRQDGGIGRSLYVKESGVGNTGWVAK